ncbi:hypothetical protein DGI_0459 [Megalodesulfovibrio gigas DSM 1382 = ATCC 19364]|uniref:Uncharacterized protein n=1 Tax=Megalodesulfovibrio gigas (strain ATCC 19364 / DSM 1382 / NCIMB 9332 / VKM B-1759) TaxID=1121448 RepID=T2G8X9_MEGG1|nr:hypothetical protein DGI_0459 [Megalodesulfovibrio gigas DSM 1382 = ATCC 19364]
MLLARFRCKTSVSCLQARRVGPDAMAASTGERLLTHIRKRQ